MFIAEHFLCGGQIGDVVGNGLAPGENFLQRSPSGPQLFQLFVAGKGIVHQRFHIIGFQAFQYHGADHAGSQNAHLAAVISGEGKGVLLGFGVAAGLHLPDALKKAFVCQQNLGKGIFRYRHCVGSPGTEYLYAAVKERPGKSLYGTGGIKHGFQRREIPANLFFRQYRHSPSGKQILGILISVWMGGQLVRRHHMVGKSGFFPQCLQGDVIKGVENSVFPAVADQSGSRAEAAGGKGFQSFRISEKGFFRVVFHKFQNNRPFPAVPGRVGKIVPPESFPLKKRMALVVPRPAEHMEVGDGRAQSVQLGELFFPGNIRVGLPITEYVFPVDRFQQGQRPFFCLGQRAPMVFKGNIDSKRLGLIGRVPEGQDQLLESLLRAVLKGKGSRPNPDYGRL